MNVLIYNGLGTSPKSVKACHASLTALLVPHYAVRSIDAPTLIAQPWQGSTALLVMPGGRDLPYCEALEGAGNARIMSFVRNGGSYLGLCAGAYYASARVEFELNDPMLAVAGQRELQFLKGICRGCAFSGFRYNSEDGARAAQLTGSLTGDGHLYYNGGGIFVDADKVQDAEILASYADQDVQVDGGKAAIVQLPIGRGRAILSAVHPEIAMETLPEEKRPNGDLAALESARMDVLSSMLQRLGLKVNEIAAKRPTLSTLHLFAATLEQHAACAQLLRSLAVEGLITGEHDAFRLLAIDADRPQESVIDEDLDAQLKYISINNAKPNLNKFKLQRFFDALSQYTGSPESLGSRLLFGETVTSSQTLLDKNFKLQSSLPHGFVLLCAHQLSGRGRGGNAWISPPGVLSFSMVMHHPGRASRTLVFMQYLVSLATVEAIRDMSGLDVRIKWPNDVYIKVPDDFPLPSQAPAFTHAEGQFVKISGSLVSTTFWQNTFIMVVGIGINVSNPEPTVALNTVLEHLKSDRRIEMELLLARLLALLEHFHGIMLQHGSFQPLAQRYHAAWLHKDQQVTLEESGQQGRVVGIDMQHGTLLVDVGRGDFVGLQADGNSFDMMKGLIRLKRS
jgi:biotin--protein ligase